MIVGLGPFLSMLTSHRPPCLFLSSSHIGCMPSCERSKLCITMCVCCVWVCCVWACCCVCGCAVCVGVLCVWVCCVCGCAVCVGVLCVWVCIVCALCVHSVCVPIYMTVHTFNEMSYLKQHVVTTCGYSTRRYNMIVNPTRIYHNNNLHICTQYYLQRNHFTLYTLHMTYSNIQQNKAKKMVQ